MIVWETTGTRLLSPYILQDCFAVFLAHLLVNKDRNWAHELPESAVPVRIVGYASIVLLIVCLGATDAIPFIYFQF